MWRARRHAVRRGDRFSLASATRPAEIQFDEHKVLTVYAHNLRPFRRVFKSFAIPRDDEMKLISEGEHLHATDPTHYPEFKRLCQRLGIAKLSRVR